MKIIKNGDIINNRYKVDVFIGEGGSAKVYKARDLIDDKKVALKIEKQKKVDGDNTFMKEVSILKEFNHSNIIKIYDSFIYRDHNVQVQELVTGSPLEEIIKDGEIDLEQALEYTIQVVNGLMAIQDKGMQHRDIKPANLLIASDNRVKIVDFGAALKEEGLKNIQVGTEDYMSPERIEGTIANEQSEIYSVGIMLYEMLTGEKPFISHNNILTKFENKKKGYYNKISKINSLIPESFIRIVEKMMHHRTTQRHLTLKSVSLELKNWRDDKLVIRSDINNQVSKTERNMKNIKWFALALSFSFSGVIGVIIWMVIT